MNTTLQRDRKSSQLERLLSAMADVAAADGYAGATIAQVIARAGVSRPTFYDYFADKDDCFLAALGHVQERLLAEVRHAVHSQAPEHAAAATIGALIGFADSETSMALLLINEAMAGGPRALDARDQGIAEIEQIIEQAYEQLGATTAIPDLSARIMIGAIYRLLSSTLRRGEPGLAGLHRDLLGWIKSYEQPAGEHRWRTLAPLPAPAPGPATLEGALHAPPPGAPACGRGRPCEAEVAENRRRRVLFALAEIVAEKGYAAVTIAEITRSAGLDSRAFYRLFACKREAFSALHELYFQQMMAVTAGAFFTAGSWPERVWQAKGALAGCIEQNPTLTRACLIESHAGERITVERVEGLVSAFTMFLQEGYEHATQSTPPSRLALEAIAQANFEVFYQQARASATPEMAGLLGHTTQLCLTPFMGPRNTNKFIDEKLGRSRRATAGPNGARSHGARVPAGTPRAAELAGEHP